MKDTDPHIPLSTVRSVLEKLVAEGDIEPVHISVDEIINKITQHKEI